MGSQRGTIGVSRLLRAIAPAMVLFLLTSFAQAQGPQFDVGSPPGRQAAPAPSGNRWGRQTSRISRHRRSLRSAARLESAVLTSLSPGLRFPAFLSSAQQAPGQHPSVQPMQTTQYGDLQLDIEQENYGLPGGLTLDAAIEQLVSQNLDLLAAKLEVPMADADVLTANLRANPIFYADTQLIPYGHFSFLRPGGPPQSDININYPLDLSFKRLARTRSAREAKKRRPKPSSRTRSATRSITSTPSMSEPSAGP